MNSSGSARRGAPSAGRGRSRHGTPPEGSELSAWKGLVGPSGLGLDHARIPEIESQVYELLAPLVKLLDEPIPLSTFSQAACDVLLPVLPRSQELTAHEFKSQWGRLNEFVAPKLAQLRGFADSGYSREGKSVRLAIVVPPGSASSPSIATSNGGSGGLAKQKAGGSSGRAEGAAGAASPAPTRPRVVEGPASLPAASAVPAPTSKPAPPLPAPAQNGGARAAPAAASPAAAAAAAAAPKAGAATIAVPRPVPLGGEAPSATQPGAGAGAGAAGARPAAAVGAGAGASVASVPSPPSLSRPVTPPQPPCAYCHGPHPMKLCHDFHLLLQSIYQVGFQHGAAAAAQQMPGGYAHPHMASQPY